MKLTQPHPALDIQELPILRPNKAGELISILQGFLPMNFSYFVVHNQDSAAYMATRRDSGGDIRLLGCQNVRDDALRASSEPLSSLMELQYLTS